jgi:hypothetical protein
MTDKAKEKATVKRYCVMRGIESDHWRHEAGSVVTDKDIPDAPIVAWLRSGVLVEDKDNGNGKD